PGAVHPSLQSFYTGVDSADRERVKNWFMHARERGKVSDITYDVVTRAGKRRTVHQRAEAIVDSSGTLQELHAAVQDITEQKQAEEEIRRLAYFDTVTGLPNRAAFEERLSQAVALAKRNDRQLAVLFLDLDNFKRINDTLGHTIGDLLLKEIAGRLLTAIRRSDTVTRNQPDEDDKNLARLGGDEFIVLLSEIRRSEDAAIVANRILETLSQPVNVAGHEISVTPSIGIAVFPKDGDDVESLLKNADVAMYAAKRRRKNQYQFFAEKMNATALWRLKLEERLRKALERQELELHYQPLVDLSTEKILGVEALLRWNHSKLGQVPPAEFIPVAEETGLIAKIGEWVLRSACSQAKAWRNSGLPIARMSVNISVVQFVQSNFVDLVVKILKQTGLEADALELEVTESLLMKNAEEAVNTLNALKKLGIGLAIDDFGMGYSSLAHLKRLPIDRVKIDPTFICGLDSSPKDAAIVRAILAMALTLDLGVIAEGVETVEHLRFLKAHGCNEAQGHYFGRPLPHADVAGLLRQAEYKENDTARVLQA
ncbi:MAG: EAL domain-containing protein, partial [Gammaproteobacteria bacterium]|nr:EAL domain-containing protein [Gammaproteobacteria bacterium]